MLQRCKPVQPFMRSVLTEELTGRCRTCHMHNMQKADAAMQARAAHNLNTTHAQEGLEGSDPLLKVQAMQRGTYNAPQAKQAS